MSEILFNSPRPSSNPLQSQLENFQTTLASLNQRVYILHEALQERDQEIADLKTRLSEYAAAYQTTSGKAKSEKHIDGTLTIIGALIKLYKFVFPPGKDSTVPPVE